MLTSAARQARLVAPEVQPSAPAPADPPGDDAASAGVRRRAVARIPHPQRSRAVADMRGGAQRSSRRREASSATCPTGWTRAHSSDAAVDWLDPYGLWSVAPDAVVGGAFEKRSARADRGARGERLAELRGRAGPRRGDRPVGRRPPRRLRRRAVARIRRRRRDRRLCAGFRRRDGHAPRKAPSPTRSVAASAPSSATSGPPRRPYVDAARARYFPELDARATGRASCSRRPCARTSRDRSARRLGAARRGVERLRGRSRSAPAGAPLGQGRAHGRRREDRVGRHAAARGRRRRAVAGGRRDGGPQLRADRAARVRGVRPRPPAQAVVLRAGEKQPVTTWLDGSGGAAKTAAAGGDGDDELPVERVEYGEGDAIVVAIHDVRDDLGDELTRAILRERERQGAPDQRASSSTCAATAAARPTAPSTRSASSSRARRSFR